MTISLQKDTIELNQELEIILVMRDQDCVDYLISWFKTNQIQSDVFWMRDPMQFADYIESTGSYRGKNLTATKKCFIVDGKFGIESFEFIKQKISKIEALNDMPLYVLSTGLTPLEHEIFTFKGINLVHESIIGQINLN